MKRGFLLFSIMGIMLFVMSSCGEQKKENIALNTDTTEQTVVDVMMTRRSVRAYKPEPVPHDIMDVILKCGVYAPNGMNKQPWEIRVVDNQEMLKEMTDLYLEDLDANDPRNPSKSPNFRNMFRNAPTVVFIAMKDGSCSPVDCGLLAGNMVNTAWAYGIGSCIQMAPMQFMNSEKAKPYLEKLSFSEGYEFLMVIGFGYPDEEPETNPRDMSKIRYIE